MITVPELEPAAIRAAHARDRPSVHATRRSTFTTASRERLGVPVVVKVETVNPIRSFKGRGTWLVVHGLAGEGRIGPDRPVACVSAGNFGQGIAYAARALGIPAIVFTSRNANTGKVERMRALGADVIAVGETVDDARAASEAYAREHPVELVVDGDDPRIACGAGTMALEVTDAAALGRLPKPVAAMIPVGNGALINGVASWLRATLARLPRHRRPGRGSRGDGNRASAPAAPSTRRRPTPIADGIATRVAIPNAVALMAGRVDEMRLVSEAALHDAQAELTTELGITVEGAAAATWAGALAGPRPDGPVLLIVTGSNV